MDPLMLAVPQADAARSRLPEAQAGDAAAAAANPFGMPLGAMA